MGGDNGLVSLARTSPQGSNPAANSTKLVNEKIVDFALSPDQKYAYVLSNKTLQIVQLDSNAVIQTLRGNGLANATGISVSPDNLYV